jgi:hypothetical protein
MAAEPPSHRLKSIDDYIEDIFVPVLYLSIAEVSITVGAVCVLLLRMRRTLKLSTAAVQAVTRGMDLTGIGMVSSLVVMLVASIDASRRYGVSWTYCISSALTAKHRKEC